MGQITIVIPIWWRDIERVKDTIPYLIKYVNPKKIILAGPEKMRSELSNLDSIVEYVDGNLIVPGMSKETISEVIINYQRRAGVEERPNRAGWLMQQFIKFGYALWSDDEEYLVWDADVLLINEFELKADNKPKFFLYDRHMHVEYLPTIERLFGEKLRTQGEYTFVNHYMLFESAIVKEMLEVIGNNGDVLGDTWWEKCINAIGIEDLTHSGFSEFETYGEYVINKHPELYYYETKYEHLLCTKRYFGENIDKKMIEWIAPEYRTIGFEGYDNPNEYWMEETKKAYSKGKKFSSIVHKDENRERLKNYYRSFRRKLGMKTE